jgi:tetratricopeptide (TPR) repeat protein
MTQKAVGSVVDRPILLKFSSAVYSYSIYLKKFFAPYDLASFYPYSPVSPSRVIFAVLVLTVISVCVWRYRQQRPWLITGWLWFLGLLVPVIGIISVGAQAYADRYTYLPIVGVCIVVVWLFADLKFSSRVKVFLSSAAMCIFMLITWKQVGYWKDGFTLYHRELEVVKGNWHAHFNLGSMLVDRKRYDEGITHYREALLNEYAPRVFIIYNLGVAYERKGDTSQALDFFRSAVQLMPGLDKGYLGQARILSSNKDMTGALSIIREGLGKVADKSLLQAKEAYLLHMTGDLDGAVKGYRLAIALSPYYEQNYINLGVLLLQQGKGADFSTLIDQLRRVNPAAATNLAKMR